MSDYIPIVTTTLVAHTDVLLPLSGTNRTGDWDIQIDMTGKDPKGKVHYIVHLFFQEDDTNADGNGVHDWIKNHKSLPVPKDPTHILYAEHSQLSNASYGSVVDNVVRIYLGGTGWQLKDKGKPIFYILLVYKEVGNLDDPYQSLRFVSVQSWEDRSYSDMALHSAYHNLRKLREEGLIRGE